MLPLTEELLFFLSFTVKYSQPAKYNSLCSPSCAVHIRNLPRHDDSETTFGWGAEEAGGCAPLVVSPSTCTLCTHVHREAVGTGSMLSECAGFLQWQTVSSIDRIWQTFSILPVFSKRFHSSPSWVEFKDIHERKITKECYIIATCAAYYWMVFYALNLVSNSSKIFLLAPYVYF